MFSFFALIFVFAALLYGQVKEIKNTNRGLKNKEKAKKEGKKLYFDENLRTRRVSDDERIYRVPQKCGSMWYSKWYDSKHNLIKDDLVEKNKERIEKAIRNNERYFEEIQENGIITKRMVDSGKYYKIIVDFKTGHIEESGRIKAIHKTNYYIQYITKDGLPLGDKIPVTQEDIKGL